MRPFPVVASFFGLMLIMFIAIYTDYEVWITPTISKALSFLNLGNFLFVLAATFCLGMLVYSPSRLGLALKLGINSFSQTPLPIPALSQKIVQLAALSRSDGIMALEKLPAQDDFLQHGINLILQGGTEERILAIMNIKLQTDVHSLKQAARIILLLMLAAPVFGFIATLVAVIYENTTIEQLAMSVLLLPSLYGFILAACVFAPLYYRLEEEANSQERFGQFRLLGLKCIIQGEPPNVVQAKLVAFAGNSPKFKTAKTHENPCVLKNTPLPR